jgi:hypothetical protein
MSILIQKHEPKCTPGKSAVIGLSGRPTSVVLSNTLEEDSYG